MVRYKKRYFVFQLDRHLDVINYPTPNTNDNEGEPNKKKKRGQKMKAVKKRSLCDPKPLEFTDCQLSNAIKDVVLQIHGDFGRAAVTMGLRTIYCNPETRLCLVQCRHGPHRLVASSLPFMDKIGGQDKLIPRLIYTGATIRNCYKKMATLLCSLCKRPLSAVLRTKHQILWPHSPFALSERLIRTNPVLPQNKSETQIANVFDRKAKLLQRERAAQLENVSDFDYFKEEMGYRLADRVLDISRGMEIAVDISCGRGFVARHLTHIKKLFVTEMSPSSLNQCQMPDPEQKIVCESLIFDEDNQRLPFEDNSVSLVTSSLSAHWINNLPGFFSEVKRILKNDGVFIGSMFGGETLFELRCALQLAELEREGGFGSHVSPFVEVQDLGSLLNRAGFTMLTIDSDEEVVRFPTIFQLMRDLKGMAENNATWTRKPHLHRDTLLAANAIYSELYGDPETGALPATFQVYFWIGWKPDVSQPKALKPQTSDVSLKDIYKLDEILTKKKEDESNDDESKK